MTHTPLNEHAAIRALLLSLSLAGVLVGAAPNAWADSATNISAKQSSTSTPKRTQGDPWERVNRATYAFNDALDRMLARPAAKTYEAVTPTPVRNAVGNFLENLYYPIAIVNDALQLKLIDTASDTARFTVNSTVGIAGFFDPATRIGLKSHEQDFGHTLGYWGVPAGPYLVLPLFGPSDVRDAPGKVLVDRYATPSHYLKSTKEEYGITLMSLVDKRTTLLATDDSIRNAFDPYAFVRNAYVARRYYLVHDGKVMDETYDEPIGNLEPMAPPPNFAVTDTPVSVSIRPVVNADALTAPTQSSEAPGAP